MQYTTPHDFVICLKESHCHWDPLCDVNLLFSQKLHHEMLSDRPRTLAYQRAIKDNAHLMKGKVRHNSDIIGCSWRFFQNWYGWPTTSCTILINATTNKHAEARLKWTDQWLTSDSWMDQPTGQSDKQQPGKHQPTNWPTDHWWPANRLIRWVGM